MRLNIFNSLMGLCVATAAVSCSDGLVEDNLRPVGSESDMISFVVANENNATRGGSLGNRPCGGAILRSANGADSLYLNVEVADITDDPSTRAIGEFSSENKPTVLHMSCRLRTNDSEKPYRYYFKDTEFSKGSGDIWSSNPAIYWFPEGTHYNFFGYYAPKEAETLKFNGNGEDDSNSDFSFIPKLEYTVPEDLAKHIDLAYSLPKPYENIAASAAPESVPVTIKHALTKIILKTGSNMADGVIESVSFTDVKCRGELNIGTVKDQDVKYDDQECEWTLDDSTQDFTLSGLNVKGNNQDITPAEKCFMLLPESATANSKIVIMFRPEGTLPEEPAKEYELTLSDIPNLESWKAGKCYTYTINIKPEVGIVIEDLPEYVDAHYVIVKAHVDASKLNGKEWTLSVSTSKESSEKATIVSKSDSKYVPLHTWYEDGYWTDNIIDSYDRISGSARGDASVKSKAAEEDIYIFIPENLEEEDRDIIINATVGNNKQEIYRFNQLCPAKSNGMLIERIEEPDEISKEFIYPWGFTVDTSETITYRRTGSGSVALGLAYKYWLPWWTGQEIPGYIESETGLDGFIFYTPWWEITIHLDKIPGLTGVAESTFNGKGNTWEIYKGGNIDILMSVINTLKSYDFELKSGNTDVTKMPVSFAALACIKKNKFNAKEGSSNDETMYDVTIKEEDLFWYLPAKEEAAYIKEAVKDLGDPLENEFYWTSTAVNNSGEKSVVFNEEGTDNREIRHRVRACRIPK